MFKNLSVKEDCKLRKAFNEEVANKELGWLTKMRHFLESYRISNLILNTLKVLRDEIDKKEKNKYKFFQKELRNDISKHSNTYKNEKNITSYHKQNKYRH